MFKGFIGFFILLKNYWQQTYQETYQQLNEKCSVHKRNNTTTESRSWLNGFGGFSGSGGCDD